MVVLIDCVPHARRQALDSGGGLSKDFGSSRDLPFLLRRQRVAYTLLPA